MILLHVLPVMIDGCKVPSLFYFNIKFLEQVIHKQGHTCAVLVHYYIVGHTLVGDNIFVFQVLPIMLFLFWV